MRFATNQGVRHCTKPAFSAQPDIVELLLDAGANPTSVTAYGITPLDLAPQQLDSDWKAVYEHTYKMLSLELDFKALSKAHARVRDIFKLRSIKPSATV